MKLRYFTDDYIKFGIQSEMANQDENIFIFSSLKDAVVSLYDIKDHLPKEKREYWMPNVYMHQTSRQRSSKSNHILHFCESAAFFFNSDIKLYQADFKFRDTYDLNSGGARFYARNECLEFYDCTLGDRNADDYYRNKCEDRELAEFLLALREPITY